MFQLNKNKTVFSAKHNWQIVFRLMLLVMTCAPAQMVFSQSATVGNINNSNTNNIDNSSTAASQAYLNFNQTNSPASSIGGAIGSGIVGVGVNLPPGPYSHSHLYSGAWNFIAPSVLFHPSKTIGDNSPFGQCRIVHISANLHNSMKDRLFGVFDERVFISSGVGRVRNAPFGGGPVAGGDSIIACGLNTFLPRGCVMFIGSGNVFMENYSTSEAALVALSQMAAKSGANLVGNVNCAYSEAIQSFGVGLGAGTGVAEGFDNGKGAVGGTLGGSWGTGITKRPAQPFCTGDFFVATLSGCVGHGVEYAPAPRLYRRYLPSPAPIPMMPEAPPAAAQSVRGLW